MIKRISLFVCLAIGASIAQAQRSDTLSRHLQFTAAGDINRTNNAVSYLLNNEVRFSIKSKKTNITSSAGWVYGELGNELTNNDFITTHVFDIYTKNPALYYWGLANYTTSFSLKINSQLQSGLGVGYNIVDTATAWLNISDGLLFETSTLAVSDGITDSYQTLRNSLRLSYHFDVGKALFFDGANFIQNSLSDGGDYILRLKNSAGIKVNSWLSFTTSLTYNQLRRTGRENLLFTYGLTASKRF